MIIWRSRVQSLVVFNFCAECTRTHSDSAVRAEYVGECKDLLFWVYLCYMCLSGILVGKYLCPFEFLMGKISVYPRYPCHPHHPSCSVRSASRVSLCLQSIHVIAHSSPIEYIFQAHKFVLKEGVIFNARKHQKLGFWKWPEVSSREVDQLWSPWRFPGVELGRGEFEGVSGLQRLSLKGVCWEFGYSVRAPHSEAHVFWCGSAGFHIYTVLYVLIPHVFAPIHSFCGSVTNVNFSPHAQ